MFNNLCLAQRAAEPLQLALIESRAERRPKHILTAQLLALKERALGRGAPRRAPTNSPGCAQYGRGMWGEGGEDVYAFSPTQNTRLHARTSRQTASRPALRAPGFLL